MCTDLLWGSMKPDVVKIDQDTVSQEGINGLIACYHSPPGIAVVEKLPSVLQRSNEFVLARMPVIMADVNAATKKALADAKPNT